MASLFTEKVLHIIKAVPVGQVISYGQVAAYAGIPRGARQVGGILKSHDEEDVPWWRVINNQGRISIKNMFHGADEQVHRLEAEGVVVADFAVNMHKYRFQPSQDQLKAWDLDEVYQGMLWNKFKRAY